MADRALVDRIVSNQRPFAHAGGPAQNTRAMTRSADPARREEVLSAVASVMQVNGVHATRLQDIGDRLGIAYTTLYHYFTDRDHLLEEVLLWTLEKRRECLQQATGSSALDVLLDFAARDIATGWEHKVAMPFLAGLPSKNRIRITESRAQLLRSLVDLIERGISEGSIRNCHSLTIANLVLNCLERFVSFDEWLASSAKSKSRKRVTAEVVEVLQRGILASGVPVPEPAFTALDGATLAGEQPGVAPEFNAYERVMRSATRAFNRWGASASIPRMAKEVGVSKSVFYNYAIDKRDLLNQCYLRGVRVIELSHRIATLVAGDPVEEILIHRNNLFAFHGSEAGPFAALNAIGYLHPAQTRVLQARNAAVRSLSENRLIRGAETGLMRENLDPQITQALFGQVLYGLSSWHEDSYPLTVMEVAKESEQLLMKGLQP